MRRVVFIYVAFAILGTLIGASIAVGLGLLGVMSTWVAQLGRVGMALGLIAAFAFLRYAQRRARS